MDTGATKEANEHGEGAVKLAQTRLPSKAVKRRGGRADEDVGHIHRRNSDRGLE